MKIIIFNILLFTLFIFIVRKPGEELYLYI